MKKILVTGANGYLGRGIVETLINNDFQVIAADYQLENPIDSNVNYIPCDIFKIEDPFSYFGKPDIVLHLAWRNGFAHYADSHINDLPMHYSFLKKMAESGAKHIAVMGSMHEIGFFEGSVKADTACNPSTPYGIAKNALRELTKMLCENKDIAFQWLRAFYIVGSTTNGSSVFSRIALAAQNGEKEFPFTKGLNQYDFLDYQQFCKLVVLAISQTEELGIINICSGRPEKLADRVERFIKDNKYEICLKYGAFPDRPYDSKAIWGDDVCIQRIISNAAKGYENGQE